VVKRSIVLAVTVLLAPGAAWSAQAQAVAGAGTTTQAAAMVNRTAPAFSYGGRRGSVRIGFQGTALMRGAAGEARVEVRSGTTRVNVRLIDLQNPTSFGLEYLTFILWAISPEGRAFNLGELAFSRGRSSLDTTTPLQTFALVVTAEPYYAVRSPSDVVVLENTLRADTGELPSSQVRYELIERGGYVPTGYRFDPVLLTTNLPQEFFQARNAMRIAQSAGAEQYAPSTYDVLVQQMMQVDSLATERRVNRRALVAAARQAVQTAEDARALAVRQADMNRLEAERLEAARREAEARQRALEDAERRARAEADQLAAERARQEAEAAAEAARRAQAEAEERRLALQRAAEAEAARNREQVEALLAEREALRSKLQQQLNNIFETEDTARGLIINLADVTFATGQATLQPQAREKLAQVSGILLAYPSLRIDIEGHTDNVGSAELNQGLSERRADTVWNYLRQLGVPESSMTSAGYGFTRPVASNNTADGRARNRRVELVVTGDVIGIGGGQ
jgi:outer membrane protein OmpA-like peptidoglycan-associated protein